jgi:transcriptional regulator with XRE-family HTH domain
MARGFIRVYRTYNYIDKNPVIDKVRTIIQDEGLIKKLGVVHEVSGVATATIDNWLNGDTRNPQHHTIAAVVTSLGYEERFVKAKDLDLEKEREIAAKWQEKQNALKEKSGTAKPNGTRKPKVRK